MTGDSRVRRVMKRALYPLLHQSSYSALVAMAKSRDIRRGRWTEPEVDLIPFAVRPGETVIDLGANFGLYTYHLSRAVGPTGKVYAFEPLPFAFETLRRVGKRLRFDHNVEFLPRGCGERTEKSIFRVPLQSSGPMATGSACLGTRNDDRPGREEQVNWDRTVEVWCELVRLDDFLPHLTDPGARLSLIKSDIEGAELFAFRGAERIIGSTLPSVLCEVNPWFLEGFGIGVKDLTSFFLEKGYRVYRYDCQHHPKRLVETPLEQIGTHNYLFIHPDKLDRFASLLGSSG